MCARTANQKIFTSDISKIQPGPKETKDLADYIIISNVKNFANLSRDEKHIQSREVAEVEREITFVPFEN